MSFQVVIQPSNLCGAEVEAAYPGVRQLIARVHDATLVIQVPARTGGLADTAVFARRLGDAAIELAEWCEEQEHTRTFPLSLLGPVASAKD